MASTSRSCARPPRAKRAPASCSCASAASQSPERSSWRSRSSDALSVSSATSGAAAGEDVALLALGAALARGGGGAGAGAGDGASSTTSGSADAGMGARAIGVEEHGDRRDDRVGHGRARRGRERAHAARRSAGPDRRRVLGALVSERDVERDRARRAQRRGIRSARLRDGGRECARVRAARRLGRTRDGPLDGARISMAGAHVSEKMPRTTSKEVKRRSVFFPVSGAGRAARSQKLQRHACRWCR